MGNSCIVCDSGAQDDTKEMVSPVVFSIFAPEVPIRGMPSDRIRIDAAKTLERASHKRSYRSVVAAIDHDDLRKRSANSGNTPRGSAHSERAFPAHNVGYTPNTYTGQNRFLESIRRGENQKVRDAVDTSVAKWDTINEAAHAPLLKVPSSVDGLTAQMLLSTIGSAPQENASSAWGSNQESIHKPVSDWAVDSSPMHGLGSQRWGVGGHSGETLGVHSENTLYDESSNLGSREQYLPTADGIASVRTESSAVQVGPSKIELTKDEVGRSQRGKRRFFGLLPSKK